MHRFFYVPKPVLQRAAPALQEGATSVADLRKIIEKEFSEARNEATGVVQTHEEPEEGEPKNHHHHEEDTRPRSRGNLFKRS